MARNARRSQHKTMPLSLWYGFRSVNARLGREGEMNGIVDRLLALFAAKGIKQYGGERVSQSEHALPPQEALGIWQRLDFRFGLFARPYAALNPEASKVI